MQQVPAAEKEVEGEPDIVVVAGAAELHQRLKLVDNRESPL